MIRKILNNYRKVLYKIYGRESNGVLSPGERCVIEDPTIEITKGDVVHPCVRFIPNGFLGHKWWMVYTPYYAANASLENPILCYGDSENNSAPREWSFYCNIQNKHKIGYNSDPNLLFDDGKLYVFWRENQTEKCIANNVSRLTHFICISEDGVSIPSIPLLSASKEDVDHEVSPAFIATNDGYKAYATSIRFFSPAVRKLPKLIKKPLDKFLLFIDLIGITPIRKAYGIAIWGSDSINLSFKLEGIYKFKNKNKLYHPWHLDVFEWNGERYAVVQSNQCNADILLAKQISENNFEFFKRPLMTNKTCGKLGLYKPTALVVDGVFHLFYTAQDCDNRSLNKLYVTSREFDTLLKLIK